MQRSLPGQQAGSSPVYQHLGVSSSGRTPNAGAAAYAGGTDWVGDRNDVPGPVSCTSVRKDGNPCVAKPVGDHEHCIGHLRRSGETV